MNFCFWQLLMGKNVSPWFCYLGESRNLLTSKVRSKEGLRVLRNFYQQKHFAAFLSFNDELQSFIRLPSEKVGQTFQCYYGWWNVFVLLYLFLGQKNSESSEFHFDLMFVGKIFNYSNSSAKPENILKRIWEGNWILIKGT